MTKKFILVSAEDDGGSTLLSEQESMSKKLGGNVTFIRFCSNDQNKLFCVYLYTSNMINLTKFGSLFGLHDETVKLKNTLLKTALI